MRLFLPDEAATNELGQRLLACLPENLASQALLRRIGFGEEGYAREFLRINGRWQDHLLFGMLRDDWRQRRR